jgi:cell division septum initiation protein DivIVA
MSAMNGNQPGQSTGINIEDVRNELGDLHMLILQLQAQNKSLKAQLAELANQKEEVPIAND